MKKFLDELYENYPELENSKDSIDKAVYYLKDNKPVFNASSEFKNHLKSRIDWLIWLKTNKKNNFLLFAIPLFSFVFIVAWFLYYFKDITFFNWPNNARNFEISNLKTDDNLSNNEQQSEEKSENNVNDESIKNVDKPETIENINNENIAVKNTEVKNITKVNSNNQEISTFSVMDDPQNTEKNPVENDEISTVLDAIGETYDFKMIDSTNNDSNIDSIWDTMMPMSDMSSIRSFKVQENYDTFTDFCSNNWWTIYEAWNDQICRVNKKECLSSNYVNWTCEFIEMK